MDAFLYRSPTRFMQIYNVNDKKVPEYDFGIGIGI